MGRSGPNCQLIAPAVYISTLGSSRMGGPEHLAAADDNLVAHHGGSETAAARNGRAIAPAFGDRIVDRHGGCFRAATRDHPDFAQECDHLRMIAWTWRQRATDDARNALVGIVFLQRAGEVANVCPAVQDRGMAAETLRQLRPGIPAIRRDIVAKCSRRKITVLRRRRRKVNAAVYRKRRKMIAARAAWRGRIAPAVGDGIISLEPVGIAESAHDVELAIQHGGRDVPTAEAPGWRLPRPNCLVCAALACRRGEPRRPAPPDASPRACRCRSRAGSTSVAHIHAVAVGEIETTAAPRDPLYLRRIEGAAEVRLPRVIRS